MREFLLKNSLILLLIYTQVSGVLSAVFVQLTGFYVTEISGYVDFSYAFIAYAFIVLFQVKFYNLFSGYLLRAHLKCHSHFLQNLGYRRNIEFLLFLVALFMVVHVLISGSPFFNSSISRFNFWSSYAVFPIWASILGDLSLPVIICISVLNYYKVLDSSDRSLSILSFAAILYFVHLVLIGHKMNGLFFGAAIYFSMSMLGRAVRNKPLFSRVELGVMAFFLLLGILLSFLFFLGSSGGVIDEVGSNPVMAILYRMLVLQGYAWPSFWNASDACVLKYDQPLMVSAIETLAQFPSFYIDNGINLANIFPGVLLCSGYGIGSVLLVVSLFSLFLAFMTYLIMSFLREGSIFRVSILMLIVFVAIGSYPAGNLGVLFLIKTTFLLLLVGFLSMIRIGKTRIDTR